MERRRGIVLVSRDLHNGANLTAEFVSRAKAPIGVIPPFLDEFPPEIVVFSHVSSLRFV
jgi:hypothetical protein